MTQWRNSLGRVRVGDFIGRCDVCPCCRCVCGSVAADAAVPNVSIVPSPFVGMLTADVLNPLSPDQPPVAAYAKSCVDGYCVWESNRENTFDDGINPPYIESLATLFQLDPDGTWHLWITAIGFGFIWSDEWTGSMGSGGACDPIDYDVDGITVEFAP